MDQRKPPVFMKMKVTGPRTAEMTVDDAAVYEKRVAALSQAAPAASRRKHKKVVQAVSMKRTAPSSTVTAYDNPTQQAIAQTEKEVADALSQTVPTTTILKLTKVAHSGGKERITASSANAIYDMCMQRLRALKSNFEQAYGPLVQLLAQQQDAAALASTLPGQPSEQVAAPTAASVASEPPGSLEPSAGSNTIRSRVLDVLSKQYQNKYMLLTGYLNASPNTIRVSASGHPVINGVELPGSSFVDVMRSLYIWRKSEDLPPGARQIIQALQSVGVPSTLLSSSAARGAYEDMLKTEQEEETYESPSEDIEMAQPRKPTISQPTTSQHGQGYRAPMSGFRKAAISRHSANQRRQRHVAAAPSRWLGKAPASHFGAIQAGRGRAARMKWPGMQPEVLRVHSSASRGEQRKWSGTQPEVLHVYKS